MRQLRLAGPVRLRDTETLVQKIALAYDEYEFVPRVWQSDRRSYFLRWRDGSGRALVIGIAHVQELSGGGTGLELAPFDLEATREQQTAFEEFESIIQSELEEQRFGAATEDSIDSDCQSTPKGASSFQSQRN